MRRHFLVLSAVTAVALSAAAASAASAQDGGQNYSGTPPWNFRSDAERATRTNQALATVAVRNGATGFGAGGFGGSGFGPSSTSVGNITTVNNTVNCYSGDGAVGSPVTCTGGTNTVTGNTQTNTGNQSSDTTTTGNTINTTNNQSVNRGPGVGGTINSGGGN